MSEPETALRALVIEAERETPSGLIGEWLRERGARVQTLQIDVDDRPVDLGAHDLLIPLGSELPAYDDSVEWVRRERALLDEAVSADVPVLGICFGGQMLARVLGGEAFRSDQSEIGWYDVDTRAPQLIPTGPWFQWHFDTFSVPAGATLLAESPVGPQAFRHGRHLGVQFHPEVTPQIMDGWVRAYRHELVQTGTDPDELLSQTRQTAAQARARAWSLLDAFLENVYRGETTTR